MKPEIWRQANLVKIEKVIVCDSAKCHQCQRSVLSRYCPSDSDVICILTHRNLHLYFILHQISDKWYMLVALTSVAKFQISNYVPEC